VRRIIICMGLSPSHFLALLCHTVSLTFGKMHYMEDTKNDKTIRILRIAGHAANAEGRLCS